MVFFLISVVVCTPWPTLIPLLIHTSAAPNQNPPIINNNEWPVLHNVWNSFVCNPIHIGFASALTNLSLQSPLEHPYILYTYVGSDDRIWRWVSIDLKSLSLNEKFLCSRNRYTLLFGAETYSHQLPFGREADVTWTCDKNIFVQCVSFCSFWVCPSIMKICPFSTY